jgi:cytochrome d ubiquinol oxidase subunit I
MQRPVGAHVNQVRGRAELTSIWQVLTNKTALFAFGHTITAAVMTAGMVLVGISAWHRWRHRGTESAFFSTSLRWGLRSALVAGLATIVIGHFFGQWMTKVQPMKMASAEALYETKTGAGLSLFALGGLEKSPDKLAYNLEIPGLLSFIATDSFTGKVQGINDVQAEYQKRYGPGDYVPVLGLTYWSFRLMIGLGFFTVVLAAWGLWLMRGGRDPGRWFTRFAVLGIFAPLLANSAGWTFTEAGRQPWVVQGLLKTADGVSPIASSTVLLSLVVLTLLYAGLAVIEVWLFLRVARHGPDPAPKPVTGPDGDNYLPSLAY